MIPALLGLIAPVAAVKVLSGLVRAAGAALRSATAPAALPVPPVVEKAAEVSEQVSDSPVIFAYDGMSRRTKITELSNGTVTSKKLYFWLGGTIVCERDGLVSGFPITKQYFGQGEVRGATKLYYAMDHLGSIRELVDSAGTVQAEYRYSTYGERTKTSGNLESDWGYAGLWHHAPSGLDLATYRLYDAANKRWISRDPLGEGVDYNLYRYCGNDPINLVDPSGLIPQALVDEVRNAPPSNQGALEVVRELNPAVDAAASVQEMALLGVNPTTVIVATVSMAPGISHGAARSLVGWVDTKFKGALKKVLKKKKPKPYRRQGCSMDLDDVIEQEDSIRRAQADLRSGKVEGIIIDSNQKSVDRLMHKVDEEFKK